MGMRKALAVLFAAFGVAVSLPAAAGASPYLQNGIMDDGLVLTDHAPAFNAMEAMERRPEVLRVTMRWDWVARKKPVNPAQHTDANYDWSITDRSVVLAGQLDIPVLFTILGTPKWANGGKAWNHPPTRMASLETFAYAAATRYTGMKVDKYGTLLPRVTRWTAWNEPNLRHYLAARRPPSGVSYATVAGALYARMCNAVWRGIHRGGGTGQKVACGVTSPRKKAGGLSASPLDFLRAIKRGGARFDVYAHHPHPASRFDAPSARPRSSATIALGNIDVLIRELTRLYGRKRLWITEYGYQTNPPDCYGVSPTTQANYLKQAFAIARKNPRIDMMVWFLIRDEPGVRALGCGRTGWQSGLVTRGGTKKPSFVAFETLPR